MENKKIPILTQEEADRRIYEALYPKTRKLDIQKMIGQLGQTPPMSQPIKKQPTQMPQKPYPVVNKSLNQTMPMR